MSPYSLLCSSIVLSAEPTNFAIVDLPDGSTTHAHVFGQASIPTTVPASLSLYLSLLAFVIHADFGK